jgi:hypothetical protein
MAASSDIYMRDASIALIVSEHFEWTDADNYTATTACDVLDEFDGSNMTGPAPGLFVCMSGRPTDWCGGVAANINVLCNKPDNKCILGMKHNFPTTGWGQGSYPYTYWTWDAMVASHEMGHIIACAHTHNCYAYSGGAIDSCFTAEGSCFDTIIPRVGTIMSYCHTSPDPKYKPAGAMLVFHPKCITKLVNAGKKSCATSKTVPTLSVSPSRTVQSCNPVAKITVTAGGGTGPLSFEIYPYNATTDSTSVIGNICTYWLKPAKPDQKYYIRVTSADTVRAYDSVMFAPAQLNGSITKNDDNSSKDSVMLVASIPDTTGAVCKWYATSASYRLITTGWTCKVQRPAENTTAKYFTKISVGSCTAQDTIALQGTITNADVAADISAAPMRLYPNPAHDRISLLLPLKADRVWIADALGRQIATAESYSLLQVGDHTGEQIDFAISQLTPGSYWIVREVNGTTQTVAFQKQ